MAESTWDRLAKAHQAVEASVPPVLAHNPTAAVLACSDARVPPSVVFDQPAGSLFVIRVAGNSATPSTLASLDYAVGVLGVDLIVVMGHTNCGAVQAAVDGTCDGHLGPVVAPICEIARRHPGVSPDRIGEHHVARTVLDLQYHAGPVGDAWAAGRLEIRGAIHDLSTGALRVVCASEPNPTALEAP